VAAVFRGELAASFARIEHCPIALTDAVRHRPGKCAVFAALPVRMRVGTQRLRVGLAVSQKPQIRMMSDPEMLAHELHDGALATKKYTLAPAELG
jgi:hypothetical protein